MSKTKFLGGLFATLAGGLILLGSLISYSLDLEAFQHLIIPLIFGVPTLVGGLLGLASHVKAGGILVSLVAGFEIWFFITSITPSSFGPFTIFTLLGIIIVPLEYPIPLDMILIILSGILLLKSVNEIEE